MLLPVLSCRKNQPHCLTTWKTNYSATSISSATLLFTAPQGGPQVLIGIPLIENTENTVIGFFVLEAHLDTIKTLITSSLPVGRMESGSAVTLLEKDGRIIFSTIPNNSTDTVDVVTEEALKIYQSPGSLHEYVNRIQTPVLGMGFSLTGLPWYLLMEKNRSDVYAALTKTR